MTTATLTEYAVYRDGTHSAILVSAERKYTYFIPMEANEVKVRALAHKEFHERYKAFTSYPVRRAAEIFLRAPDKEISDEARGHLEEILADPAFAYDSSQFPELTLLKEKPQMARKTAAEVAADIETKPKNRKEALNAAAKAIEAQAPHPTPKGGKKAEAPAAAKPAAKKPAPAAKEGNGESKPKGRAPALAGDTRVKIGNTESVKRGFMKDFVDCAAELQKGTKGRGVTIDALVEAAGALEGAAGHDATWVRSYVSYALDAKRGILVTA